MRIFCRWNMLTLFFMLSFYLLGQQATASSTCSHTPNWMELFPSSSPSARIQAALAYDPINQQLILFGGSNGTRFFNDTWSWNGTTWVRLTPSRSPSARAGASMAFDPKSGQLILFGGLSRTSGGYLNDTWSWNGKTWTKLSPTQSPAVRNQASMAYDPINGEIILFGGFQVVNLKFKYFNDTWSWNGKTWQKLSPATSPSARAGAPMAFDPQSEQMILFGGGNDLTELGDTWNWNGTNWQKLKPSTSPHFRMGAAMAFDSITNQLILFGGLYGTFVDLNDTWNWNGKNWIQLFPTNSPSNREQAAMAFDPNSGQMILFGGQNLTTLETFNDTWNWGFSTSPIAPPTDFRGKVKKSQCTCSSSKLVHVLSWQPSPDPCVTSYNLYQGDKLIRTIPATGPFKVRLGHRSKRKCYTYRLVALDAQGQQSQPVEVTLPKKCHHQ